MKFWSNLSRPKTRVLKNLPNFFVDFWGREMGGSLISEKSRLAFFRIIWPDEMG